MHLSIWNLNRMLIQYKSYASSEVRSSGASAPTPRPYAPTFGLSSVAPLDNAGSTSATHCPSTPRSYAYIARVSGVPSPTAAHAAAVECAPVSRRRCDSIAPLRRTLERLGRRKALRACAVEHRHAGELGGVELLCARVRAHASVR